MVFYNNLSQSVCRYSGGRRSRLRVLGPRARQAVSPVRAAQPRAHLRGRRQQAHGQHGVQLQGHGAQHGNDACWC